MGFNQIVKERAGRARTQCFPKWRRASQSNQGAHLRDVNRSVAISKWFSNHNRHSFMVVHTADVVSGAAGGCVTLCVSVVMMKLRSRHNQATWLQSPDTSAGAARGGTSAGSASDARPDRTPHRGGRDGNSWSHTGQIQSRRGVLRRGLMLCTLNGLP